MTRVARFLALLPLALLPACSAFDRQWMATKPPAMANPAAPMAGKWEGTWQSDATAYWGLLQAIVIPMSGPSGAPNAQQYDVHVKMLLFEGLSKEYNVTMAATVMPNGTLHFEGRKDLGTFTGGDFNFDGYIDDDVFFCDYTSGKDCGTMLMRRLLTDVD